MEHARLFTQHGSFLAAALDFPVGQARPSTARAPVPRPLAKPRPRRVASARGAPRTARGPSDARGAAAAMAATLKRPEETMPSLISRACGGSISARGSDALRSDSRPGTAQETPRAAKGRHPVERQLVERQLLDVEEHNRRVAEQREDLLAKLGQAMVLQTAQTDRAQRAVQAEWRAELMAVRSACKEARLQPRAPRLQPHVPRLQPHVSRCARGSSCARGSCTTSSSVRASGSRPTARPTTRWPHSRLSVRACGSSWRSCSAGAAPNPNPNPSSNPNPNPNPTPNRTLTLTLNLTLSPTLIRCGAAVREAAAELLSVRQQLKATQKGVAELSGQSANPNAPPVEVLRQLQPQP